MALSTSNWWNFTVKTSELAVVGGGFPVVARAVLVVRIELVVHTSVEADFEHPTSPTARAAIIRAERKRMRTAPTLVTSAKIRERRLSVAEFLDVVIGASRMAATNTETEKREALPNTVVNRSKRVGPDADLRATFMRGVDELSAI